MQLVGHDNRIIKFIALSGQIASPLSNYTEERLLNLGLTPEINCANATFSYISAPTKILNVTMKSVVRQGTVMPMVTERLDAVVFTK